MSIYFRPIVQSGPAKPETAKTLAGGWTWFNTLEILERDRPAQIVPITEAPAEAVVRLTTPRADIAGLSFSKPRVMGILNVTPDSFSDGGKHNSVTAAVSAAQTMRGADILDIGGESTRPGAKFVPVLEEIERTAPVIGALRAQGISTPVSIDTRKAKVADAALTSGANLVNDVSGFTFDEDLAPLCAQKHVPVCVMHAQGDPASMQDQPHYDDVVLDVYDFLESRIAALKALGVSAEQIIVDPGIGFGKTLEHNLALLGRLSLFHSLGVPVLLGASRKRFIGTLGGESKADARMPGSIAVALAALKHGTQIVRVHDVPETVQAIALWQAVVAGQADG
ncbi:MAG: dihydropteroate synthase [Roseobacter sp.]